jgi:NAD(P)-dependent dehydrogenase (short-subunit alcohol dehydrogenase family)
MVTGAATGLGFETARVLAAAGASLVLAVLPFQVDEALTSLRARVPGCTVDALPVDLSSLDAVRAAAASFVASGRPLHVLINNAGVMACPLTPSMDGYELQWATNYLVGDGAAASTGLPAGGRPSAFATDASSRRRAPDIHPPNSCRAILR